MDVDWANVFGLILVGGVAGLYITLLTALGLKDKFGMLVLGLILGGPIVWTIGASRLAKPWSAWARTLYGPEQLAEAEVRFGHGAPVGTRPVPPRAAPAWDVGLVWRLAVLSAVGMTLSGMAWVAGPHLLSAAFARAGHRRGRVWTTTTAILAIVVGVLSSAVVSWGRVWPVVVVFVVLVVVPLLVMLRNLYRPAAPQAFLAGQGRGTGGPQ